MNFRKLPPTKDVEKKLVTWYTEDNLSLKEIGERLGVSKHTIKQRLEFFGIPIRTTSEGNYARYAKTTADDRKALTAKANKTRRGSTVPHETLVTLAKSREGNLSRMSKHEKYFYEHLPQHIQNKLIFDHAVDKFNIDFAYPERKLAIEIHGGNWHNDHPRKMAQDNAKRKYLSKHDWTLLVIWSKDLDVGVKDIIALFNSFSR